MHIINFKKGFQINRTETKKSGFSPSLKFRQVLCCPEKAGEIKQHYEDKVLSRLGGKRLQQSKVSAGFSLIEIVIYVGLLGILAVVITNALIQISSVYHRARAEREVLSNARLILETVNKSLEQATTVYGPTSKFYNPTGQLSLITPIGATTEHTTAYIDYYIDNGRMWMRQEGQIAQPISAADVRVNKFTLERIMQGLNHEAVKITLRVDYAVPQYPTSIILNSTTALRGNY